MPSPVLTKDLPEEYHRGPLASYIFWSMWLTATALIPLLLGRPAPWEPSLVAAGAVYALGVIAWHAPRRQQDAEPATH